MLTMAGMVGQLHAMAVGSLIRTLFFSSLRSTWAMQILVFDEVEHPVCPGYQFELMAKFERSEAKKKREEKVCRWCFGRAGGAIV